MAPSNKNNDGDWLASLARQSTSADSRTKPNNTSKIKRKGSNSGGGGDNGAPVVALTKAQRIERRGQKKSQREERKRLAEEARQQRLAIKSKRAPIGMQHRLAKKRQQQIKHGSDSTVAAKAPPLAPGGTHHGREERSTTRGGMTAVSKRALTQLSTALDTTVSSHATNQSTPRPKRRNTKKNEPDAEPEQETLNGLPAEPKGKATKSSTLRPESKELQPRLRDYNGQGLVRSSLYLPFDDPSFVPKLELEFEEHVPGFFGKSKTKAAKKQAGENMLWKRCLKKKEEEGGVDVEKGGDGGGKHNKKKGKKKKQGEGLDTMIRQGVM